MAKYFCKVESRKLLSLAAPLIAALLANMGLEIVDTIMIGWIGLTELGAAAIAGASILTILVLFIGTLNAVSICVAREIGAKSFHQTNEYFIAGLALALVFSPVCMLLVHFLPSFFYFIGQPIEIIGIAKSYLDTLMLGIPGFLGFVACREFVAANSRPGIIMCISLLQIPLDVGLNYLLIHGFWLVPPMGIAGVGLATAIINWLSLLAILLCVFYYEDLHRYFKLVRPSLVHLKDLLLLGLPIGGMLCLEVGLFSVTALLMGYVSVTALAAHQVAINSVSVAFMFLLGLSQATGIRVSNTIGSGSAEKVNQIAFSGILLGLGTSSIAAIIFLTIPETLVGIFFDATDLNNQAATSIAVDFLKVAAMFQLVDAIQVLLNGALRGMKDTFVPMLLGALTYWLCGVGSGYYLAFVAGFGGVGLWYGLTIGLLSSSILFWCRYRYQLQRVV